MNNLRFFVVVALVACVVFSGCASTVRERRQAEPIEKQQERFEAEVKEIEASKHVQAMNEKLLTSSITRMDPYKDYKIGPEDLIEITVFEDEKLNKTVRVSSLGNISLPLLGTVRVKGLTSAELEREIRELLAERYFQDPHVSIFIKEYRSQQISLIGAVDKPGVYQFMGQKTILDALALAGGLKAGRESEYAGQLLFLIRPPAQERETPDEKDEKKSEEEQKPMTFVINLEDLLMRGDLALNLPVQHGDIINVPISGKVFVGGEVRSPGGFPLTGKSLTLNQALALAGGFKTEAKGSETKIFRFKPGSVEKETLVVDAYAVQKGEAEDISLRENDIIIVPKSGIKSALVEIRDTFRGLLSFGFSLGTL